MSISTDLQAMIYRRLVADPTLAGLIGGRVMDRAPASTPLPYVEFGPSYARRDDAECIRSQIITQQMDVWSEAQDGQREAKEIVDAVIAALHDWTGDGSVAAGPVQVVLTRVIRDPDGISTHGIVQAEVHVEE